MTLRRSITGVEYDGNLLKFANDLKDVERIGNVQFIQGDFKQFSTDSKYDLILSFAVHKWIGLPMREYFRRLRSLIRDEGELLFESHDLKNQDPEIEEQIENFVEGYFTIQYQQKYFDDGRGLGFERIFYYMKPV